MQTHHFPDASAALAYLADDVLATLAARREALDPDDDAAECAELAAKQADIELILPLVREAAALQASLAWIVTFCAEHADWFGDASDDGAEHEWWVDACLLVARTLPAQRELALAATAD